MMIFAGLRHWLAVIVGILIMILAACGSGKGDKPSDTDSTATVQETITPTEAYDSVECQRLLDLNYDIQEKDIESLVTQCEALIAPMINALNNTRQMAGKDAQAAMNSFQTIRSSKPMMYATQLSGFLYLAESLENIPEDLRKRARRQSDLSSELQFVLNEALSTQSNFDPGEDDGH